MLFNSLGTGSKKERDSAELRSDRQVTHINATVREWKGIKEQRDQDPSPSMVNRIFSELEH